MSQNIENHGFLIFFISTLIVSQLRWAETYNYNDIGPRLAAAILLGTILNWGLKKWIHSNVEQIITEKWQRRIRDISFTLSFSFLLVAFNEDRHLTGVIILLFVIYLIKSNDKARTWITNFLYSKNYELNLDESQEPPVLIVKGKHTPENLLAFQYLCVDLSEIFFEMKNKKLKTVNINLQFSEASNKQIHPLITAIADSYGIEYTKN